MRSDYGLNSLTSYKSIMANKNAIEREAVKVKLNACKTVKILIKFLLIFAYKQLLKLFVQTNQVKTPPSLSIVVTTFK